MLFNQLSFIEPIFYLLQDDYRFLMGFMVPTSAIVLKESICFYGGEESEAERLETLYVPWKELVVSPGD